MLALLEILRIALIPISFTLEGDGTIGFLVIKAIVAELDHPLYEIEGKEEQITELTILRRMYLLVSIVT